jgi:SSS family solute:Na+ symporter
VQIGIGEEAMAMYLTNVSIPGFAQWSPALVGGLLWKRGTKQGAIAGTLAGVIYLLLGLLITGPDGSHILFLNLHPIVPTLPLNLIVYIAVSKLTPKPGEHIEDIFFNEVDDYLRSSSSAR